MATVPADLLDWYSDQIDLLSEEARAEMGLLLEQVDWSDVTAARSVVGWALREVCEVFCLAAAAASAEFYDATREMQTGAPLGAMAYTGFAAEATEQALRAFVQDVVDGKPAEQLNDKILQRVDWEIKHSAGYSTLENARIDPMRVRYARVPRKDGCDFCVMLGSRGFIYRSKDTAGNSLSDGNAHYHPHCRCRIVAGWDGMDVEGYDPDALYDMYVENANRKRESRKRRSPGGSKAAKRAERMGFESAGDISKYLKEAKSVEDLQKRGETALAALADMFPPDKNRDLYEKESKKVMRSGSMRQRELLSKAKFTA